MKRKLAGLAIALLLAGGTAGCSAPIACPALAWMNSVTVTLDGRVEAVSLVELCADDVCSIRSDGPATFPVTSVSPGAMPAPATSAPSFNPYYAARVDDRTWTVSLLMRSPERVRVRALSADGAVLAERDVELGWTRVGGSEQCGGPATAGPITLVV
ncbi:hypothetical protein [Pseudarthrobacter sp. H2]|uniref:hypothetical protein n=1 Tax=Pseudarthrobacter sp. H2 TaxID=3418415 RepID=UPI003CEEA808